MTVTPQIAEIFGPPLAPNPAIGCEFLAPPSAIRIGFAQAPPEVAAVVQMTKVGQLMQDHRSSQRQRRMMQSVGKMYHAAG